MLTYLYFSTPPEAILNSSDVFGLFGYSAELVFMEKTRSHCFFWKGQKGNFQDKIFILDNNGTEISTNLQDLRSQLKPCQFKTSL